MKTFMSKSTAILLFLTLVCQHSISTGPVENALALLRLRLLALAQAVHPRPPAALEVDAQTLAAMSALCTQLAAAAGKTEKENIDQMHAALLAYKPLEHQDAYTKALHRLLDTAKRQQDELAGAFNRAGSTMARASVMLHCIVNYSLAALLIPAFYGSTTAETIPTLQTRQKELFDTAKEPFSGVLVLLQTLIRYDRNKVGVKEALQTLAKKISAHIQKRDTSKLVPFTGITLPAISLKDNLLFCAKTVETYTNTMLQEVATLGAQEGLIELARMVPTIDWNRGLGVLKATPFKLTAEHTALLNETLALVFATANTELIKAYNAVQQAIETAVTIPSTAAKASDPESIQALQKAKIACIDALEKAINASVTVGNNIDEKSLKNLQELFNPIAAAVKKT